MSDTPRGISTGSRRFILLLGMLSATAPLAIDMYLPSLPAIALDLNSDISHVQQSLSLFMLGFALSQLFYGPLSDQVGRRPVIIAGLSLFLIASLLCANANSITELLIYRVLQALGGGAASVVISAVIRDLFRGEEAARTLSLVIMTMTMAPLLAPLAGAQVLTLFGWRAIFLLLAALGAILLILSWRVLPETHQREPGQRFVLRDLFTSYAAVLSHREAMGNLLLACFSFAGMFAFITGSPYVYIDYFGVSPSHYGLLFGSNILLMILLNGINSRIIRQVGLNKMIRVGSWLPLIAGILLLSSALSGFGGLAGIVIPAVLYVGSLGLLGANTTAAVVSPFSKQAGAAAALLGSLRFFFGAIAGALVGVLHDDTPRAMAVVICGSGLLAFVCYRFMVPKSNGYSPHAH